jgi:hypothetical protein
MKLIKRTVSFRFVFLRYTGEYTEHENVTAAYFMSVWECGAGTKQLEEYKVVHYAAAQ